MKNINTSNEKTMQRSLANQLATWHMRLLQYVTLVLLVVGSITFLSCQIPTQPGDRTVGNGFATTVKVEDESGNTVPGSTVEWRVLHREESVFRAMPNADHFDNGIYSDVLPIPVSDDTTFVLFRTTPPTDAQFAGVQKNGNFRLDTVIGFCGNRTFVFMLLKKPVSLTNCGSAVACADLTLTVTPPTKLADTVRTSAYTNNTGSTLTIADPVGTTIPDVHAQIIINGQPASFPASVKPGETFQILFIYSVSANAGSATNKHSVVITGASASDPNCFTCSFTLTTITQVELGCDCSKWDDVIEPTAYPTKHNFDSACVGDTKFFTVDLSGIKNQNTNANCNIRFRYSGSTSADVSVDQTSSQPSDALLAPGAALGSLTIRFSPSVKKEYNEVLKYAVEKQNPDGSFTLCPDSLKIVFHGLSDEPGCLIDFNNSSLFHKPLGSPVTVTDTLLQAFGEDTAKKQVIITNTSQGCPLDVSSISLSGADAKVFAVTPSSATVDPGKSLTVEISFHPTESDIFPNGTSGKPDTVFNAVLTITSLNGCSGQWDIHGKVIPPSPNPNCLLEWNPSNNNKVGMFIDTKGVLSFQQKDNKNDLSVYVSGFDNQTNPTQATLASGQLGAASAVTFIKVASGVKIDAPGNICDNWLQYAKDCNTGTASSVNVNVGDVIIMTYNGSLCAVMWINDIRLDRSPASGKALPEMCFQVCFPI